MREHDGSSLNVSKPLSSQPSPWDAFADHGIAEEQWLADLMQGPRQGDNQTGGVAKIGSVVGVSAAGWIVHGLPAVCGDACLATKFERRRESIRSTFTVTGGDGNLTT